MGRIGTVEPATEFSRWHSLTLASYLLAWINAKANVAPRLCALLHTHIDKTQKIQRS